MLRARWGDAHALEDLGDEDFVNKDIGTGRVSNEILRDAGVARKGPLTEPHNQYDSRRPVGRTGDVIDLERRDPRAAPDQRPRPR